MPLTAVHCVCHRYGPNWALMQNAADAAYNPSLWSLMQWHTVGAGGGFGFCQSIYDGASANATLLADTSSIYNASHASGGCNGFGHTVATPA